MTIIPLLIFLLLCISSYAIWITAQFLDSIDTLNEGCHLLEKSRDQLLYSQERRIKSREIDVFIAKVRKQW